MKKILRHYFVDTTILYVVSNIASGMVFENGISTLLLTGAGLTVMTVFGKPLINLLLLPLNLVTYGLFRWVSSAVALFLVDLIIKQYSIRGFYFAGLSSIWIDLPSISLDNWFKYVAFAFIISILTSFMYWLIE